MPRLVDLDLWRSHVVDFIKRLCRHRRLQQSHNVSLIQELRNRIEQLERNQAQNKDLLLNRISNLEESFQDLCHNTQQRLAKIEFQSERQHHPAKDRPFQRKTKPVSSDFGSSHARGRSPMARADDALPTCSNNQKRSVSVPRALLDAQLAAIAARSASPGLEALEVLDEFKRRHPHDYFSTRFRHLSQDPSAGSPFTLP